MLGRINMRKNGNNITEEEEEEEIGSWELARAFAEDAIIRNTTWPPRSYTCSFCRREFRSAQALGGHMNVHRRDRAQLHQAQAQAQAQSRPVPGRSGLISAPSADDDSNFYSSWGTTHGSTTIGMLPFYDSNYGGNYDYSEGNFSPFRSDYCLPACRNNVIDSNEVIHHAAELEMSNNGRKDIAIGMNKEEEESISEELDLELRLGIYIPAR